MLAAFDALQNFQRTVGVHRELIHALKLVRDAEAFADDLHRCPRAARGGFPAAENQQSGFVEARNRGDGVGERRCRFGRVGEAAGRTVERDEFKRHFLRDGHHHLLELGFRAERDQPDFAAGRVLGEVRGLIQRVARPRIEDGGQHHFIFQRRPGGRGDGFKRLQRIGNDAAANDDLIGCAHKILGWPRKGAKELFNAWD